MKMWAQEFKTWVIWQTNFLFTLQFKRMSMGCFRNIDGVNENGDSLVGAEDSGKGEPAPL